MSGTNSHNAGDIQACAGQIDEKANTIRGLRIQIDNHRQTLSANWGGSAHGSFQNVMSVFDAELDRHADHRHGDQHRHHDALGAADAARGEHERHRPATGHDRQEAHEPAIAPPCPCSGRSGGDSNKISPFGGAGGCRRGGGR